MNRLSKKFQQKIILGLAFFLALMLAIATGIYLQLQNNRDAIYLAVVGPTGQDSPSGIEMVQGSQLYLDRLNAEGGIDGKKVKLLVFDDRNEPELAKQKATEIVESTSALAVLGHLYSSTSIEGGKVYQQLGMPAISGSATADRVTLDNDWYFRVVFNNSLQASFIANYVHKILNYNNASIIYTKDSYGETLRESFINTFTGLGGNIKHQWQLDPVSSNFDRQQQQILADLLQENTDRPEIIFCATHNDEMVNLVIQMKRQELRYPLIGADSLGNVSFAQQFQKYGEEQTFPGYFSNGIYAVSPIIFDVASEQAQQFRNQYFQKYDSEPSWTAATYYDAAAIAVEAIKRAKVVGNKLNIIQERKQVKEALAKINTVDDSIAGVSGNLYFDRNGNLDGSIYVGTFDRTKFISAFTQLQPLGNIKPTDNFKEELTSGKILLVDGKYMQRVNIVYAGIDINEIRNLDEKNSSYLVDFYLWFRFQGDIKADNIEFTNYGTTRLDSGQPLKLNDPIDEKVVDNFTYRVYRIKADFQEKFRFDDYPFDRQQLAVRFRHNNLTRDNLLYVVDLVGMRDTVAQQIVSNWQKSKVFDTISDWELKEVNFFSDTLKNDSTLGNPNLLNSDDNLEYSRFNAVIHIKRDRISFAIKNLLPLLFLIGVSYLLLFLPFEYISVEAVSGILLAIVFFHLSLLESLPDGIGYVVALDYGFYVIYSLIGLELLLVVIGNKPEINKNRSAIKRLLLTGRIVFPTILLISTFVLLAKYRI
jgi:branched-chain amino acid transport system substrate-binding protein